MSCLVCASCSEIQWSRDTLSVDQGMVIRVCSAEAHRARAGRFEQEGALVIEFESVVYADDQFGERQRTTVIPYVPRGGKPRPWLMTVSGTNMNSRSGERGEELRSLVGSGGPNGNLQNRVQHGACGLRKRRSSPFVVRTNKHAELEGQRSHGPGAPQ